MEDRRFALRLLLIMAGIVIVVIGAEFWYELSKLLDEHGAGLAMSEILFDKDKIRPAAMKAAQSYTTGLLTMNLTFIGLAIPLTANMYTPKLIELFVRDRINLTVLCTFAGLSVHSMAVTVFEKQAGLLSLWIALGGAMFGWMVILPYYFYVLSFLNPVTIIDRVKRTLIDELEDAADGKHSPVSSQRRVNQKILNLGSVLIRAVERADRDVSNDALHAHSDVLRRYAELKARMSPEFYKVTDAIMVGSSRSAIGVINDGRFWVEQKVLTQFILAFTSALGKMPDAVSAIANEVKDLAGDQAKPSGDPAVMDLEIRVVNTFVREAVKKKDINAVFDVLYQHFSMIRKVMIPRPEKVPELAANFRYYADFAKASGVAMVYELSAQDLGYLTEFAFDNKVPTATVLFDTLLAFEGADKNARIVKPRMRLGGYFIDHPEHAAHLSRIVESFNGIPAPVVHQAAKDLITWCPKVFWEVTDRGLNFDFVDAERTKAIERFLDRLPESQRPPRFDAAAAPVAIAAKATG